MSLWRALVSYVLGTFTGCDAAGKRSFPHSSLSSATVYLVTGRNLEWFNNVKAALERYILVNNTSRNEKFIKNKVILAREVFEATGNPLSNAMQ